MDGSRLLLVRFSALGDVILTTPLVRALRTALPAARLTYVTRPAWAPLLVHSPYLDQVVTLRPGEPLRALARRLRAEPYDLALDLHGSLRAAGLRLLLGGRWRGYRKRRLERRLHITFKRAPAAAPPPVAERYFDAVRDLGVVPDGGPAEVVPGAAAAERAAALAPPGAVVLAPGASRATKRWPASHWQALADRLRRAGHAVIAVGTADERALQPAGTLDAFGLDLGVVAALMARARVVVANDSGPMHLATAVGTPVVALFGPTVGSFGFLPYRARATVLERALPCRPCAPFGSARCPRGHHACLRDIAPEEVARAVDAAA